MYLRGIVQEVDPAKALVRVRFPDRENLPSWWLEVLATKTHKDKSYWMPDVGEHVACLMDNHGEAGCILGALYSQADMPPVASGDKAHMAWDGGASVEYDRASKVMEIVLPEGGIVNLTAPAGVVINAGEGCRINAPEGGVDVDGNMRVNGHIEATGDISDATSSMQEMRDTYNDHTAPSAISSPTQKMV